MDPGLRELIAAGRPDDEVSVIVRLHPGTAVPTGLRLVARFGDVATGRAARGRLEAIHDHPSVASLKAPRVYAGERANPFADRPPPAEPGLSEADASPVDSDRRRPAGLVETGRGTIVAVIDWGIDFAHPDFRDADGNSRLIALWDQRARGRPAPYGYGRIHSRTAINRALGDPDPFAALDYLPATSPAPSHGTHVMGIAAGNGRAGGPSGIAPEAELLFVHLGPGLGDLGNSIDLLEAIDFVARAARARPLAINMSIGRHAGPHDGTLLIERAIDWLIVNRPGTVVVQSTGNYFSRNVHMEGRLREAGRARLPFILPQSHPHAATVELWYKGGDRFVASAAAPDGSTVSAAPGTNATLMNGEGRELARLYHRLNDPNNGDNLIALVLRPMAPAGDWLLEISGTDIVDGRWHAWIERNAACPRCQGTFLPNRASRRSTTGSICNAMRTIAVGAYDGHDPAMPLARFSSVGPTRDGRQKPMLAAPGVRILSVRSRRSANDPPGYVRMSGTSMAAPHVTGTAALMLQAAGRPPIASLRRTLFATLDPPARAEHPESAGRWGYGRLNIEAAVAAARRLRLGHHPPATLLEAEPLLSGDSLFQMHPEMTAMERMIPGLAALDAAFESAPALDAAFESAPAAPEPAGAAEPGTMPEPGAEPGIGDPATLINLAINPQHPGVQVIGWPGHRLAVPLLAGDLVVRGRRRRVARIRRGAAAGPVAMRRRRGRMSEAGVYVETVEGDEALRIAGPDGLLLPDVTIVRTAAHGAGEQVPAPGSRPTIRSGSRGPAVSEAQTRLNSVHGQRISSAQSPIDRCPLVVDGIFGANTRGATVSFQRIAFPGQASEWDGIIGPRTWTALIAASSAVTPVPPPPPAATATIAFVLDHDDDHRVDGGSPVATALMYGLWDQAYDGNGNVRNNAAETDNFVGLDRRRFYIRVTDPGATAATVTARWHSLNAARRADDAPATRSVTLTETAPGSHVYVSRALMLVSDDTDAAQRTHSGLTGPAGLVRARGQHNHRLRRAALDGFVRADYRDAIRRRPVSVELPVFERSPDARRRLRVRVVNYGGTASLQPQINRHFRFANRRWAQTGLRIAPGSAVIRPIPAAARDAAGRYAGSANTAAETAALNDLLAITPDNTVTVVFCRKSGANAYATLFPRTNVALGERYFIFINVALDPNGDTLGHEFHHVLFNRADTGDPVGNVAMRPFFTFNTNPSRAYLSPPGTPAANRIARIPDIRVRRRCHLLHSASPENDAANDNVLNWIKRRRTQRFLPDPANPGQPDPVNPLPAPLSAADATTGNTLVEAF